RIICFSSLFFTARFSYLVFLNVFRPTLEPFELVVPCRVRPPAPLRWPHSAPEEKIGLARDLLDTRDLIGDFRHCLQRFQNRFAAPGSRFAPAGADRELMPPNRCPKSLRRKCLARCDRFFRASL